MRNDQNYISGGLESTLLQRVRQQFAKSLDELTFVENLYSAALQAATHRRVGCYRVLGKLKVNKEVNF